MSEHQVNASFDLGSAIDSIGVNAPYILVCISVVFLIRQPKYAIGYVFFTALNEFLSNYLKQWIKEPRPVEYITDKTSPVYYGMPSGHAQHFLFTFVFLLLVKPSWIMSCLCFTIGCIALIERYKYKRHTLSQLFVGGVIGVIFAILSVFLFRHMLVFFEKENI